MATRLDNDLTISHEDAAKLVAMLQDLANAEIRAANRTKQAATHSFCLRKAEEARQMSERIVRQLYTWSR